MRRGHRLFSKRYENLPFIQDTDGGVLILAAFGMIGMVGFGALGVDVAYWYSENVGTQVMADTAALAAAQAHVNGSFSGGERDAALFAAEQNGFDADEEGNALAVDLSPGEGFSDYDSVVQVTVTRHLRSYLARALLDKAIFSRASAVAGVRQEANGTACVIALDPAADRALEFIGNTTTNIGCGIASNSASASSLYISGSATVTATPIQAYGDIYIGGGSVVFTDLAPLPHSDKVNDPFEDRALPVAIGTCDVNNVHVNPHGTLNLDAQALGGTLTICGNLKVQGTLSLTPGTYYVYNGDWTVNSGAVVAGDGVTVVMTGNNATNVGQVKINGGALVDLTAPGAGPYQGIVFYADRAASESGTDKFNGGSEMVLSGALYAPSRELEFTGGDNVAGKCTRIFARIIKFSGNSDLRNDMSACDALGLPKDNMFSQNKNVSLIQ